MPIPPIFEWEGLTFDEPRYLAAISANRKRWIVAWIIASAWIALTLGISAVFHSALPLWILVPALGLPYPLATHCFPDSKIYRSILFDKYEEFRLDKTSSIAPQP